MIPNLNDAEVRFVSRFLRRAEAQTARVERLSKVSGLEQGFYQPCLSLTKVELRTNLRGNKMLNQPTISPLYIIFVCNPSIQVIHFASTGVGHSAKWGGFHDSSLKIINSLIFFFFPCFCT